MVAPSAVRHHRAHRRGQRHRLHRPLYACTDTSDFQATVRTAAAKVPVFLSEWGTTSSDGRTGYCQNWADSWLALADSLDLSWANWSFSNVGGNSQALTGTSFTATTTSGTYVKGKIQQVYDKLQGTLSIRAPGAVPVGFSARAVGDRIAVVAPEGTRELEAVSPSGRVLDRVPAHSGSNLLEPGTGGLVFVRAIGGAGIRSTAVVLPR